MLLGLGGVVVDFAGSLGLVAGAGVGVFAGAGLVAAGLPDAGWVAGAAPVAALFPALDPEAVTLPEVGVLAGVAVGSAVIGVGTGGNGFARMPAIISLRPASD